MTSSTLKILSLFSKADLIGYTYSVVYVSCGYKITFVLGYEANESGRIIYDESSLFVCSDGSFDTWEQESLNEFLDRKLNEIEEKKEKEQKRKEVLARLTDEEKELLGVK